MSKPKWFYVRRMKTRYQKTAKNWILYFDLADTGRRKLDAELIFGLAEAAAYQPPKNFELILVCFLDRNTYEAMVGDLEERFNKIAKRLGPVRAGVWYRVQVLTSVGPVVVHWLRRGGAGMIVHVVASALRVIGLGSYAAALTEEFKSKKTPRES